MDGMASPKKILQSATPSIIPAPQHAADFFNLSKTELFSSRSIPPPPEHAYDFFKIETVEPMDEGKSPLHPAPLPQPSSDILIDSKVEGEDSSNVSQLRHNFDFF